MKIRFGIPTIIVTVGVVALYLYFDNFGLSQNDVSVDIAVHSSEVETFRQELTEEFRGAYAEEVASDVEYVEFELVADEASIEIIEGETTQVWSYNGVVPGPELRVKKGQGVRVTFTNNLPQETTIHWHGVRVPNEMDGVPHVTQEPIRPGETFVYEFVPKDAGTFWYHPHVRGSEQVERGLYGVLIVEDIESTELSDITVVIDDWLLTQDVQVYSSFNTMHDLMHDGRWGNIITANSTFTPSIEVEPGSSVRLRLINPSNGRVYRPDFGELGVTVIAVDGMYVKEPFGYVAHDLAPGNRLDVVVKIPEETSIEYVINDVFTRNTISLFNFVSSDSVTVGESVVELPHNENVPIWKNAVNMPVDNQYVLDARRGDMHGGMGMMGSDNDGFAIEWTINGRTFAESEPIELKQGIFQKIRFKNNSARLHPMHLHGQFFKVLSRNGEPSAENFFRDTVLIYPNETVDIGLVPLDVGEWASHCHVLEHAEAGMMTTVLVK